MHVGDTMIVSNEEWKIPLFSMGKKQSNVGYVTNPELNTSNVARKREFPNNGMEKMP